MTGLDRGERPAAIEPLLIADQSPHRAGLADLALDLAERSARLKNSLPSPLVAALSDLVRAMNCYYSNLIEGHDTHPVDIERALQADFDTEPHQRHLQLEASAHIQVQQWIDRGGIATTATAQAALCSIHRQFYERLPDELRWVDDPETQQRIEVVPGQLRDIDVRVGRHIGVSPGAIARLLAHCEQGYATLGKVDAILAAASAHHRILFIHPFLDGNGRVARLMSHAMLNAALDTGGLWSVTRGLARAEPTYKRHLAECDLRKRNDLDGRGALSEEALAAFTEFFLQTCIDQVTFMIELMQPDHLRHRVQIWCEEQMRAGQLPARSAVLMGAIVDRGAIPRHEITTILDTSQRTAQRVVRALLNARVISTASSRAPLVLAFPSALAGRWMPHLFPDK